VGRADAAGRRCGAGCYLLTRLPARAGAAALLRALPAMPALRW